MSEQFKETMTAIFDENHHTNEVERAQAINEVMMETLGEIDNALEGLKPEAIAESSEVSFEPHLVKVYNTLDHISDLLSIIAAHTAANIEGMAMGYEAEQAIGELTNPDEEGDTDTR